MPAPTPANVININWWHLCQCLSLHLVFDQEVTRRVSVVLKMENKKTNNC